MVIKKFRTVVFPTCLKWRTQPRITFIIEQFYFHVSVHIFKLIPFKSKNIIYKFSIYILITTCFGKQRKNVPKTKKTGEFGVYILQKQIPTGTLTIS